MNYETADAVRADPRGPALTERVAAHHAERTERYLARWKKDLAARPTGPDRAVAAAPDESEISPTAERGGAACAALREGGCGVSRTPMGVIARGPPA